MKQKQTSKKTAKYKTTAKTAQCDNRKMNGIVKVYVAKQKKTQTIQKPMLNTTNYQRMKAKKEEKKHLKASAF
ncbi:MAG: hypothetical protein IKC52_00850 [Clostridia bacterium]|nr:hypothetical protein [Clostridia bacterium]